MHARNFLICSVVLLTSAFTGCGQSVSQHSATAIDDLVSVGLTDVDPEVHEFLSLKQSVVRESPDNSSAIGELAMAYEMNGFADSALIGYRQAATLAPSNNKWPYFESLVLASFGDYEGAVAALDRALKLDSKYSPGWIWKGRMHLELDELSQAANAFQYALDTDAHTAASVGLAQVALREDDANTALNLLKDLGQHNVHPQVEQLIRVARTRLGISVDAGSSPSSSIPGQIGFPDPLSAEKRSYEVSISAELTRFRNLLAQPGRRSGAFELIDALFEEYPENKRVVIAKAQRLRVGGDTAKLNALLEQAHATWPTEVNFILGLAELEIASHNSSRALELLDSALALDPANVWGLLQRGIALAQNRDFREALETFQQALQVDESAEIHYYIANAFAELDDFSNARCHIRRAVELDPAFKEAIDQLRRLDRILESQSRSETDVNSCSRKTGN